MYNQQPGLNLHINMKFFCIIISLIVIASCKNSTEFTAYLNQFPIVKGDTLSIIPSSFDCSKQKNRYPRFLANNKKWIYPLSSYSDTNLIAWPCAAVQLEKNNWALVTASCNIMGDEYFPGFWLAIFNQNGDTLQNIDLNPFLFEEAHNLAILYQKEKFITLYENVVKKNFLRITLKESENTSLFISAVDTLTLNQFQSQYSEIQYEKWPFEEITNTASSSQEITDTIYTSNCDLDMDGIDERILIYDAVPDNSEYQTNYCYTLQVDKKESNRGWKSWIVSTKAIPAMNKETTAYPGGYKCQKGYFSFSYIDEGQNTATFEFRYDKKVKDLILDRVVHTDKNDKQIPAAAHNRPSLSKFDFNTDPF
jgi:hypothetical protein